MKKALLIWAGIMSSGNHSAMIFITSTRVPSTAMARLIVADSCTMLFIVAFDADSYVGAKKKMALVVISLACRSL